MATMVELNTRKVWLEAEIAKLPSRIKQAALSGNDTSMIELAGLLGSYKAELATLPDQVKKAEADIAKAALEAKKAAGAGYFKALHDAVAAVVNAQIEAATKLELPKVRITALWEAESKAFAVSVDMGKSTSTSPAVGNGKGVSKGWVEADGKVFKSAIDYTLAYGTDAQKAAMKVATSKGVAGKSYAGKYRDAIMALHPSHKLIPAIAPAAEVAPAAE